MPRRPTKRPNPDVVALLERWMAAAYRGDLRDIVLLGRFADGEYLDEWDVGDNMPDMIVELRSTVIRAQTQADEPEPAEH
jgi:hypothetical protein